MKKQLFLKIFVLGVITPLLARSVSDHKAAYKTSDVQDGSNPSLSVININNHAYWIYKDGSGTYDGSPNGTQADYPVFTGGLIYKDGAIWGVKSNEYQFCARPCWRINLL